MLKNDVLKKHFQIAIIYEDNRPVAICNHRTNFDYDFFFVDGEYYTKVDKKTEEKLRKTYKFNGSPINDIQISNMFGDIKYTMKRAITNSAKSIMSFIEDLSPETKDKVYERINTLNFITENEYKKKYGELPSFFTAAYHSKHHIIFGSARKLLMDRVIEHEMLHASSRNNNESYSGLQMFDIVYKNMLGRGLNEAATDYFACDISKKPQPHPLIQLLIDCFGKLIEMCDIKKIKEFYFNSNYIGFVDYMSHFYHLSLEDITQTVLTFEALYNSFYSLLENESNRKEIASELYKNIISMQINKLKVEGKSLDDYTFESEILNKKENVKLNREIDRYVREKKLEVLTPKVIAL